VRLNIGSGNKRLPGYTGVDAVAREAADIVAPAWAIPLGDGAVEEIMAIHVFEHFYRWECDDVIVEWKRLLKSGGKLVLELPDFLKACQNVVSGFHKPGKHPDQLNYWAAYGDPRTKDPFMAHRWGWTPDALMDFLKSYGFTDIKHVETQFHRTGKLHRDMRIEAMAP
jgi:predicted SAM-dependent methyltransferase